MEYERSDAFRPPTINPVFARILQSAPYSTQLVPKLKEYLLHMYYINNTGQGDCEAHKYRSIEEISNSFGLGYSVFQSKYYPESAPKGFNTNTYP